MKRGADAVKAAFEAMRKASPAPGPLVIPADYVAPDGSALFGRRRKPTLYINGVRVKRKRSR